MSCLMRCQDINTHDIDIIKSVTSYHTRGRISTTCVMSVWRKDIDGLAQDCSNPIANALELLQSCTVSHRYKLQKQHLHQEDILLKLGSKHNIFYKENSFDNIAYKMSVFFCPCRGVWIIQGQWTDSTWLSFTFHCDIVTDSDRVNTLRIGHYDRLLQMTFVLNTSYDDLIQSSLK